MKAAIAEGGAKRARHARYQPLVLIALAVCAGILADRCLSWPLGFWWTLSGTEWLVWWLLWRRRWDRVAGAALLVAAAGCGGAWHHCRWNLFSPDDLGFFARRYPQPICLDAVVVSGPRRVLRSDLRRAFGNGPTFHVHIEVVGVRDGEAWIPASGRARLVGDGAAPQISALDRIRVLGQLTGFQPPHNPGEFDFAAHHRADRVLSMIHVESPSCITRIEEGSWWNWRRWIDAVRERGGRVVWEHLDPRRAGLASAVLLGCREEVTVEQTEAFVQTGTIHILSISGMHVGILAASVFAVARLVLLPRGAATILTAAVTAAYTLLADAQPPAVRALVLVLVTCGAYWLRRNPLGMNSLAAAALVVLALNPADLFRVGPQLSFLCLIVLILFPRWLSQRDQAQTALEKLVWESRSWASRAVRKAGRWAWELTVVGAAIWAVTAPLIAARFHLASPVAVALSTLLWLPMTAALWCGFAALAASAVYPSAVSLLASGCDRMIAALQWGIDFARRLPGGYWWIPGPADWWLAGLYAWLGILVAWPRFCPPRRWFVAILWGG